MLLEAEEASEKKAFKKMNHKFEQFNSALSLDLHLTHAFSLTLRYFSFKRLFFSVLILIALVNHQSIFLFLDY